ncbi:adenosine deaminase, partial [Enterococcus faecalis]
EYPFQQFIEAGLPVCINIDNRTVSDTTLTKEFMKLPTWYELSYDEMKQLTKNALAGAYLSPDEKKLLKEKIDQPYLF